jgi:cyclopropane fatty-acyl-phospholipid synthase-like methyltransferase
MNDHKERLYRDLTEIHHRPEPFETYTAELLWDDDFISQSMLAFHLNPESEPASRPHAFIEDSAAWIADRFALGEGKTVADFGCGPGLYATRFAEAGAAVTGLDFSRRSIAHAEQEARRLELNIEYILGDYLQYEPDRRFELITLIYCDLCALSPDQRRRLLTLFAELLTDEGSLLLDVFTVAAFDARQKSSEHGHRLMGGFWAPGDYWGFADTFKYEDAKVALDKYTIVEPHQTRRIYNWLQYFSLETLAAELEQCGLQIVEKYNDVSGAPYCEGNTVISVVAQKAGS